MLDVLRPEKGLLFNKIILFRVNVENLKYWWNMLIWDTPQNWK